MGGGKPPAFLMPGRAASGGLDLSAADSALASQALRRSTVSSFDRGSLRRAQQSFEDSAVVLAPPGDARLAEFDVRRDVNMLGVEQGQHFTYTICLRLAFTHLQTLCLCLAFTHIHTCCLPLALVRDAHLLSLSCTFIETPLLFFLLAFT